MTLHDEVTSAELQSRVFGELTDREFVAYVRKTEQEHPVFVSLNVWQNAVDREIRLRMLLKDK